MDAIAYAEKLAAAGDELAFGDVTKYQHVERLGSENVEGLLDGFPLVVQEKIDGCNLSVWLGDDGGLCIASRNHLLYGLDGGATEDGKDFRGAVAYVTTHHGISDLLEAHPDWVLRGEWLVKHTVTYGADAWNEFYVFDVQTKNRVYVDVREYGPVLREYGVEMVPLMGTFLQPLDSQGGWAIREGEWFELMGQRGVVPDCSDITSGGADSLLALLVRLAGMPSMLGAPQAEGIVIKRYGYVNKFGRTQWGKVVNSDFAVASKARQCADKDPPEIRFVARCITDALIEKTIGKIRDAVGSFESAHIGRLLETTWHDAFLEELYDFVQGEKVKAFDFHAARKLANEKIRGFALAHLGGSG